MDCILSLFFGIASLFEKPLMIRKILSIISDILYTSYAPILNFFETFYLRYYINFISPVDLGSLKSVRCLLCHLCLQSIMSKIPCSILILELHSHLSSTHRKNPIYYHLLYIQFLSSLHFLHFHIVIRLKVLFPQIRRLSESIF
jgi:hypothetical protein